jgi:hypothetical protein
MSMPPSPLRIASSLQGPLLAYARLLPQPSDLPRHPHQPPQDILLYLNGFPAVEPI